MKAPINRIKHITLGSSPKKTFTRILITLPLAFLLFSQILIPARPTGISMAPTYPDGGFRFINCTKFWIRAPARGDVVVIRMAGKKSYYLKRLLALPEEEIAFKDGQLLINGALQDEPYLTFTGHWTMPPLSVEPGQYFVGGDNRRVPIDQHVLGTVQKSDIIGGLLF